MRAIKWIASTIIVASLIFLACQVFLLNDKISEQNETLAELQHEQYFDGLTPILDLGLNVGTFPHTNRRGITAISAMPMASSAPLPGPVVYILRDRLYPELLLDIYAYNNNYISVDPIFVTADDTVLAFISDYSDRNHLLAKILRITLDGEFSEVYSCDCRTREPGGYFWGEDARSGTIWKGHKDANGIRIIKSDDDGQTWTVKYTASYESPPDVPFVYEIAAYNNKVFAALNTPVSAVLYSEDGGDNWSQVLSGLSSIDGISIFAEAVYAVTAGEEIWIAPNYTQPTRWFRVYLPRYISLGDTTVLRQTKMLGRYIVTNGLVTAASTTYYATPDNFYTVSPIFRFGPVGGDNERFSGFGNTIYIGGSRYGDGMIWKGKIPDTLTVKIPCLREILSMDSLSGGATSSLGNCWEFDSRLSSTFTLNVKVTYDSSATQGIKIHVISSADGREFDTEDTYTEIHPFNAGQTVQKTYTFNGSGVIKVQIDNLDDSHTATDIQVIATLGA